MRIAVLGTGMVGRTLAARLAELGHEVVIGTRDVAATASRAGPGPHGEQDFASWHTAHAGVRLVTFAEAGTFGEIVVNATSGAAARQALRAAGKDALAGKVVIDVANPLDFSHGMPPGLDPVNTDSLGEQIQCDLPDAKVVKTLNTMNCLVMADPGRVPGEHNVFVCGNDAAAKATVSGLLESFGWPTASIIDLGDITAARGTEMLLPVWLRVMMAFGHSDFNFHIQRA